MTPQERADNFMKVLDAPSKKEVAFLISELLKSVKVALKQTQDSIKSDMEGYMKRCEDFSCETGLKTLEKKLSAQISDSAKKTSSEAYKALSNEVYKLERAIRDIPQYDDTNLEAKWASVISGLEKEIGDIKAFSIDSQDIKRSTENLGATIKSLQDSLVKLDKKIDSKSMGRVGGMRKVPIIKRYNLTNQVDGNTRSFLLPADTVDVLGVYGTQFPINFNPGTDWSLSGRNLVLGTGVTTPESGQTLYAILETLFY